MRYASIRSMDISNGEGVGISLFVQGCPFHCKNCFNPETWSFNSGKEWTDEIKAEFLKLANRSYIKRISILGGEPLAEENLKGIRDLVYEIRVLSPVKKIWIYSGYNWEHIFDPKWHYHPLTQEKLSVGRWKRQQILSLCDILVDGLYQDENRDIHLAFKGSHNQRIIDVQKSIRNGEATLWE